MGYVIRGVALVALMVLMAVNATLLASPALA